MVHINYIENITVYAFSTHFYLKLLQIYSPHCSVYSLARCIRGVTTLGRGGGGAVATRIIPSANRKYILLYRYIQRIYSIMDSGNKNTYR